MNTQMNRNLTKEVSRMKKRLLYLILPIVTLILEVLPYGAVCNFASGPNKIHRQTFSYFDLVPFGYANFAPLITAVLTCGILVLLAIYCFTGKPQIGCVARIVLCVCAVISLGPLAFGISYFSATGALITASLIAELLLLHFTMKAPKAKPTE